MPLCGELRNRTPGLSPANRFQGGLPTFDGTLLGGNGGIRTLDPVAGVTP